MNRRSEEKKPNYKLYLIFAAVVIVIFGVYRIVISGIKEELLPPIAYTILMWVYLILAGVGFIAVVVLNRGFSGAVPTADELPSVWNHVEKQAYIDDARRRRKLAKCFLVPTIAFLFVFIYEIIELYYFPAIAKWFASF